MISEKSITFAIHTIGCKTNQAESDDIARQLILKGCRQLEIPDAVGSVEAIDAVGATCTAGVVSIASDAACAVGVAPYVADAAFAAGAGNGIDYIIINTCTVTTAADRKARHLLRKLKNASPKSKLIITGCFAELHRELANDIPADFIFSNSRKKEIADFICNAGSVKEGQATKAVMAAAALTAKAQYAHSRAFVKIQDGCCQGCTYCIVPLARGPYLSTDPEIIINDIKSLVSFGHDEIVLTGIHIGKFGVDLLLKKDEIKTLPELILEILKNTGVKRLRLSSIEINEIDESLVGVIRNNRSRIAPHLHIPLQSGSDKVLKTMNRKYDSGFFISAIEHIKRAIPDITLTTDIIVGFPGETGQDFTDTIEIVKSIGFSKIHVFKYSIRPGTKAAGMAGQVQEKTKTERSSILRGLGSDLRNSFMDSNISKKLDVACEEYNRESGIASGTSENYIKVYFDLNHEEYKEKKSKILTVFTKSLYSDGLYGEAI